MDHILYKFVNIQVHFDILLFKYKSSFVDISSINRGCFSFTSGARY